MNNLFEIIPAIDLLEGKCVRLVQGDYAAKTIYHEDPLVVAKQFEEAGITRLHLVDLDGAKAGKIINHAVLERIARNTNFVIDFGGGLKSSGDIEIAFKSGASMVTGGSIAVKNRELFLLWLEKYGSEKIILGADSLDGLVSVSGWLESTKLPVIDFINNYYNLGIRKVIATEISRDGMLTGPGYDLYSEILEAVPGLELIASGGVSSMDDISRLQENGLKGVIVGKAIYENRISLEQLAAFQNSVKGFSRK